MLLTLMSLVDMFGGVVPPPPPPTPITGGAKLPEELALEMKQKLIKQDEEDFIILMAGWIADKSQDN